MADLTTGTAPRRRGRPKGTGIDDTTLLRQITSLMANDPALKPTTAIKKIGIDNPSIVRRLREKLKVTKIEALTVPPSRIRPARSKRTQSGPPAKQRARRNQQEAARQQRPHPAERDGASAEPKAASHVPDTSGKEAQKAREATLLAAYLKALQATAVPAFDDEQQKIAAAPMPQHPQSPPSPATVTASIREPMDHSPHPADRSPLTSQPAPNLYAAFAGSPHQPALGMTFPFMPPFLQPFAPKPPPTNPLVQNQMEALKLSVEVMNAVAKLQMFTYQNALAGTPFGNMLQAQTMMGQMLLASFAGMMGSKKTPDRT